MESILGGYEVNKQTWFYLSFLLILAVFFKFNRIWSLRNLDLGLLLAVFPGLLLVDQQRTVGFVWLFSISALLLARVLWDTALQRRPKLEPNMNSAGLMFLCASAFVFLMTKVMTEPIHPSTTDSVRRAQHMLGGDKVPEPPSKAEDTANGPGSSLVAAPVVRLTQVATSSPWDAELVASRMIVILAHLAVIVGLICVGRGLFQDFDAGIAMATLYMLLPCTAHDVSKGFHVLPAALVVWALVAYRRPTISGILLGLASGILFFPVFLLPLWVAFYGRRGAVRFVAAVLLLGGLLLSSVMLTQHEPTSFLRQTVGYLEWEHFVLAVDGGAHGFWNEAISAYRIPVFATFVLMLIALTIWPRQKDVGHLVAHSAAVVIGIQFWYLQQGGVYILWYLPLLLVVVFRPTLTQHIAPELQPLVWFREASHEARQAAAASHPPARRISV